MPKYGEVFQRVEKKYRIKDGQRGHIEQALAGAGMQVDSYGRTRVTSLYLDTPAHEVIGRSIEKPIYKEKLRLRAYGDKASTALIRAFEPGLELDGRDERITVFFELKKKFKGIVYKRRIALSIGAALAWLEGADFKQACLRFPADKPEMLEKSLGKRGMQISHEIECALHRWSNLEAKMVITCEREAWVASSADSLVPESFRVTFDDNLSWLEIGSEPLWSSLLDRGESIMEIKSVGPYPMWMIDALDQTCAYPRSFSKYGAAYLDIETQKHAEPVQHRNARHLRRKNPKMQPENVAAPTLAW